ncbi:MAG: PDZ domain-containing protein [Oscillospiraceae bacterium]|jgi:carboxyl-terminal processing protease|nr:PDZ domain-containing protein [Oscillospiraceae bacterium]
MNRKISLGKAIALTIIAVAVTIAITMSVSMRIYDNLIKDLPGRVKMYSAISSIDDVVRKEFFGEIDEIYLNKNIARGYIEGLNDKSSFFMTADEYIEYYNREQGRVSGIGITHRLNTDTGNLYITGVAKSSPAESAGLKIGDEITKIGGDSVTATSYKELSKNLEGEKMTNVNVTYTRGGESKTVNVVIGYSLTTVSYRMIGNTAFVTITGFYENTVAQFKEVINEIRNNGATGIIFDVRNCSQGSIKYAIDVIDVLVPLATDGTKAIATAVNSDGKTIKSFPADADDVILPIVVLTNEQTSGGAELLACDLRDFKRAEIVGTTTGGVGTMQSVYQFEDGSAVVLTVAEIIPYKSDSFNKVGVKPDYDIKLTSAQSKSIGIMDESKDPHIKKALSLLPQE